MRIIKQGFTQGRHCYLTDEQEPICEIELKDGGGGEFVILRAEHWAIDSEADITKLADAIKALLAVAL